ncbi:uncharacterized protein BDR25DRAFT_386763 [Lindgomyces ingoldianus]|uniref:Uncharacterized protein n=1 Tax=Lindgomyces ingoldianus TaxID=673940 RepID=A0ACB6R5W3_9PLEO|nr:uncharacterized protein BDR25DRAFT_386763 [Lindgomyces ingoldianus]KAF2473841.1 hypothetical protein BDR25DRAFT_386763 [Lindgomyces ingoldianus]
MADMRVALLVPPLYVKRVKSALEERKYFDRKAGITSYKDVATAKEAQRTAERARMIISTNILQSQLGPRDIDQEPNTEQEVPDLLMELGLQELLGEIHGLSLPSLNTNTSTYVPPSPFLKALREGLKYLPKSLLDSLELTTPMLLSSFPGAYSVYNPMLLLPSHALSSPPWTKLLSSIGWDSPSLSSIWKAIAGAVGATHVALNAGIPPRSKTTEGTTSDGDTKENILRSPINLTPLYGYFGPQPSPTRLSHPTQADFDAALWVSTCQNGIHQVWAPLYTMFSRGNIREKTRLLNLPSVRTSVSDGRGKGKWTPPIGCRDHEFIQGCTAVDLYAGIGYFSFSYKKAGCTKVLCWELNPWSVEGLRRGAELNGWSTQVFTKVPKDWSEWHSSVQDVDFLVFQQSNESAICPISCLGGSFNTEPLIPRIRHVNCGLLPSSNKSWWAAIRAVDSTAGGWIHVHENVAAKDVDTRKDEVVSELQDLLNVWEQEKGSCGSLLKRVSCDHVERVKTFAPGVLHIVFDIWVNGTATAECAL